jgi:hypothetical protein
MRRTPALLLAAVALTLTAAGCAQPASQYAAAPDSSATTSGAPSPAPSDCRSGSVTVTEAQDGQSLCVRVGTRIEVYLHGSPDTAWSAVTSDGAALTPTASGKGALPLGVTGGFFQAAAPGAARLTASRPGCPSAPPGGVRCMIVQPFAVTVTVR